MLRMVDRVHPDAIAQQRAARLAPGRVDRDDRQAQPVVLVEPDAAHQFVGERALAGAAGAGDAQRGGLAGVGALVQLAQRGEIASSGRRARPFSSAVMTLGQRTARRGERSRPACHRVRRGHEAVERGRRQVLRQVRSQRRIMSPIMPCRPMRWPSSGE
jgi:hypothetical protein